MIENNLPRLLLCKVSQFTKHVQWQSQTTGIQSLAHVCRYTVDGTMQPYFKVVALAIMSKSNLNNFWWIGRVVGLIYVAAVL